MPSFFKATAPVALLLIIASSSSAGEPSQKVTVIRTPDGGLQPQALVDAKGTLHLIYFKGEAKAGDIYYVKREAGQGRFTNAIRVNSQVKSAVAVGTVRTAQMAIGKEGRLHVAWNGAGKGMTMNYTRMNDAGTAFEDQRNLMQTTDVLDGGGSVAADAKGNVYVAWHGNVKDKPKESEATRQFWVVSSTNEGKTFTKEMPANTQSTGACACCASKAFSDSLGNMNLLYRAATGVVNRDLHLLASKDNGKSFQSAILHPWKVPVCPMSTFAMVQAGDKIAAAWETEGQVFYSIIQPGTVDFTKPQSAPGKGTARKHPALAFNANGDMLMAWTEGTGWQKGGALVWQIYDKAGKTVEEMRRLEQGVPVWGHPAVVAYNGGFLLVH